MEKVAERADVTVARLSEIERERVPPPPPGHRVLRAYAELFSLSTRALDRLAERERRPILLGVPWHKRTR